MKTNVSRNKRAFMPSPGLSTSQDFPDSLLTIPAYIGWGKWPHATLWAKSCGRTGSATVQRVGPQGPKGWPTGFRGLAHRVQRDGPQGPRGWPPGSRFGPQGLEGRPTGFADSDRWQRAYFP